MSKILYYLPEITLFILVCLLLDLIGSGFFRNIVRPRARRYWAASHALVEKALTEQTLPPAWLNYLRQIGHPQTDPTGHIRLRLKGVLRSKPQGNWYPAECKAFFTLQPLSMVWYADLTRAFMLSVKMTDQYADGQGFSTRWALSSLPYRWRKEPLPAPLAQRNAFYALAAAVWQPSWWLQHPLQWAESDADFLCFTCQLDSHELSLKATFTTAHELSELSLWDKNWQNWQTALHFHDYQEIQGQKIPFRVEVLQKNRREEVFVAADLELTDWVDQGEYAWW